MSSSNSIQLLKAVKDQDEKKVFELLKLDDVDIDFKDKVSCSMLVSFRRCSCFF